MDQRMRWLLTGAALGFLASDALVHISLVLRLHGVL